MSQAIFVTGTGTDIGKTYVSACLTLAAKEAGFETGYYKPVLSGSDNILESDAGFVRAFAELDQEPLSMVSYLFHEAVSPHLAAAHMQQGVDIEMLKADFAQGHLLRDVTIVEGCGGIVCPLTLYADGRRVMQEDVIRALGLSCLVVADAGLGTINATVLTLDYMRAQGLDIAGVIVNRFDADNETHVDNLAMIERLAQIDVVATVTEGGRLDVRKPFFVFDAPGV